VQDLEDVLVGVVLVDAVEPQPADVGGDLGVVGEELCGGLDGFVGVLEDGGGEAGGLRALVGFSERFFAPSVAVVSVFLKKTKKLQWFAEYSLFTASPPPYVDILEGV
jgi:hypothetical protein